MNDVFDDFDIEGTKVCKDAVFNFNTCICSNCMNCFLVSGSRDNRFKWE